MIFLKISHGQVFVIQIPENNLSSTGTYNTQGVSVLSCYDWKPLTGSLFTPEIKLFLYEYFYTNMCKSNIIIMQYLYTSLTSCISIKKANAYKMIPARGIHVMVLRMLDENNKFQHTY